MNGLQAGNDWLCVPLLLGSGPINPAASVGPESLQRHECKRKCSHPHRVWMKPRGRVSGPTQRARPVFTVRTSKIFRCNQATPSYFARPHGKNRSRADGAGL